MMWCSEFFPPFVYFLQVSGIPRMMSDPYADGIGLKKGLMFHHYADGNGTKRPPCLITSGDGSGRLSVMSDPYVDGRGSM
jgi:hypothetical protein